MKTVKEERQHIALSLQPIHALSIRSSLLHYALSASNLRSFQNCNAMLVRSFPVTPCLLLDRHQYTFSTLFENWRTYNARSNCHENHDEDEIIPKMMDVL